MKTACRFLIVFAVLVLFSGVPAQAQAPAQSKNKESTVWVTPKAGSLIGGGYTDSGVTTIQARTLGQDTFAFRNAIYYLDEQGGKTVRGVGLVPTAVAWQTKVRIRTLIEQQAQTHLSYGELLVANSVAEGSGKSLADILALREKVKSWGALSRQLHINPESIQARAKAASNAILYADARNDRRREQNMKDAGNDIRHMQNAGAAPHPFGTDGK
ncbi:MAG TPA: hypothetical protein VH207_10865 [Chthoniobacterales bacterium]|jgi:hypothetical protein|nr:hypothetical protein [Chthoniobacterales bacterium]